jgi:CHAT domain-containing protein/tetratricopeptide (TPR) repeat protein
MRRILAWLVFATVLAIPVWPAQQALAQQNDTARQDAGGDAEKAAELARLWQRLWQTQDPDERSALAEGALRLEREVQKWPLALARDEARWRLLWTVGASYAVRPGGDRAENIERAIAAYEQALQIIDRDKAPKDWAALQFNLGLYRNRVRGDRADNLEKAIAAYKAALTVRTRETLPTEWAQTEENLGRAYLERVRGDQAENLKEAIAALQAALTVLTREASPTEWAQTQDNLARGYFGLSRSRGDRAENLEKAIAAYEAALTVRTRETSPAEWAQSEDGLGGAYADRIRGDRADNIEKAITAYEAALTVIKRETVPTQWAQTMDSLGLAYLARIKAELADNTEKAIAIFEEALTVRTRDALSFEWAQTENNLGFAYVQRVRGERADNMEKAIALYEAALTVRTPDARPGEWAQTQANLGNAYSNRVRGTQADNPEKAIAALEAALTVFTREDLPTQWAQTQRNLAMVYWDRIRGDEADNNEKAIAAFEAALTVLTREAAPLDWAYTQDSLGLAYRSRVRGDQAENREKAIAGHEAALTVFTREALPNNWAPTQVNLAMAYGERTRGDRADNLERAIAASNAALTVITRESLPYQWAVTQNSLGDFYRGRIRGDQPDNLKRAIAAYRAALTVFTPAGEPCDHLTTALQLGGTFLGLREWREAGLAYGSARDAFLLLFGRGIDESDARALIEQAGPLFSEAAYAAAQRGDVSGALALASEGRAKLLTVALRLGRDSRPRVAELRAALRTALCTADLKRGTERAAAIDTVVQLRQELLALVKEVDPYEHGSGSVVAQAYAVVAGGGAVVVPIVTKVGSKILIVTRGVRRSGSEGTARHHVGAKAAKSGTDRTGSDPQGLTPIVLDLPDLTTDRLNALLLGDAKSSGWRGAYSINQLPEAAFEERWPEWLAAIDGLGPQLWTLLGGPLDGALKQAGVGPGARIVWLPSGGLGILPLGLAQDAASNRRLADTYEIVYAPSLEALAAAQQRITEAAPPTLAAVVNPTGDLADTEKEGQLVASHFPARARTVLERAAATPEAVLAALKGRSYWHFASHGSFSWDDARQSALIMHAMAPLSVGRLLEAEGLGRPRLVVLSACETGLYDINRSPDEFIGLPGTFAALGAAGVLGTLWPVSDTATALLIAKFYELHMDDRLPPSTALWRAQLWLRQATNADLQGYARIAARQGRLERSRAAQIGEALSAEGLTRSRSRAAAVEWVAGDPPNAPRKRTARTAERLARPYAHPYYWAGFIYTGL